MNNIANLPFDALVNAWSSEPDSNEKKQLCYLLQARAYSGEYAHRYNRALASVFTFVESGLGYAVPAACKSANERAEAVQDRVKILELMQLKRKLDSKTKPAEMTEQIFLEKEFTEQERALISLCCKKIAAPFPRSGFVYGFIADDLNQLYQLISVAKNLEQSLAVFADENYKGGLFSRCRSAVIGLNSATSVIDQGAQAKVASQEASKLSVLGDYGPLGKWVAASVMNPAERINTNYAEAPGVGTLSSGKAARGQAHKIQGDKYIKAAQQYASTVKPEPTSKPTSLKQYGLLGAVGAGLTLAVTATPTPFDDLLLRMGQAVYLVLPVLFMVTLKAMSVAAQTVVKKPLVRQFEKQQSLLSTRAEPDEPELSEPLAKRTRRNTSIN